MKISVIIPVYNAELYICRCLDSVINQSYKNWEVIAIDDGSKDKSYSILLEYSLRDERFKVFSQENKGPGCTRNKALELILGDYVVFLDSDDYIESDYFDDLVKCVNENDSDVVFIDVIQEDSKGKVLKYETMSKYKNDKKDTIIRHQMTGKLPWGGCRKAVRSSIITNNDIRYSEDTVGEEALFSFRILKEARNISFIEKYHYHYVNNSNSQSKKGYNNPWGGVCNKISEYLKNIGMFEEYKKTINSFAYTAVIVSIYRISQNYTLLESIKLSRNVLKEFKYKYSFELDKDSLEFRTRMILPLAKVGSVFPIVLISKLKTIL